MKRTALCMAAVGAAATLVLGMSGNAYAAKGEFIYTTVTGDIDTLDNPTNNHCYNITGEGHVVNKTDKEALVFKYSDCRGSAESIDPSKHAFEATFQSVEFVG